ncbi:MAG: putative DNA-binding protein [Parcubacteria group bacterium]|nr:putative DNA-binding protein [Parcubacteria group bacterium]
MIHPIDIHIGKRLRRRRKFLGHSLKQVGLSCGVTYHVINNYESGRNPMRASFLLPLSQALDVPVGYFFEGFEETRPVESEHNTAAN